MYCEDCGDRRAKTKLRPKSAWQIPWSRGQIPLSEHVTKGAWLGVDPIRSASSQHDPPDAQHRSRSSRFVHDPEAVDVRTQTSPILYTKMRILSTGICPSHQSLFNLIIFPWRSSLWTDILLILMLATIGALRFHYRTDCPAQTTAPVLCVSTGYTFSFPPVSREGNFQ